jgi:hypothetical protein
MSNEEHIIKIDPTNSFIKLDFDRRKDRKLVGVRMIVDLSFEEFKDIAKNPYLHTGFNEVHKCSTEKCEGWYATVNGQGTGEECYNACGHYYCENCVDIKMKDDGYSKICKKCK